MNAFPKLAAALVLAPLGIFAMGPENDSYYYVEDDECDELELDEAEVFIEFNSTDGDFGIQFFWDGEPWRTMKCEGPDERTVLSVRARRSVARQGLTEGFFESAEPSLDELSMEEFLARFPEGEYEFEGMTLEGEEIEGETEFTHVLPAAPVNLYPADGDEIDANDPLIVSFDAVTMDLDGEPLEPELYEVIVETENDILRVFSMVLEGDVANPQVTIPPEFLDPETEYKFEVIVQEESGNRTISETEFSTN
ncbi:MAG: hypothetical protein ACYTG5_13070 [Planctomycetota bacterium]|jgi:hypothetical protein